MLQTSDYNGKRDKYIEEIPASSLSVGDILFVTWIWQAPRSLVTIDSVMKIQDSFTGEVVGVRVIVLNFGGAKATYYFSVNTKLTRIRRMSLNNFVNGD